MCILTLVLFIYYLILRLIIFEGLPNSAQFLLKEPSILSLKFFIMDNQTVVITFILYVFFTTLIGAIFNTILEFLNNLKKNNSKD